MFQKHVHDKLAPYCEGLLPKEVAKKVQEHLQSCEKCSKKHRDISRSIAAMQSLSVLPIPENAEARILARLQSELRKDSPELFPARRRWNSRIIRAAIWIVALSAGIYYAFQYYRTSVEIRVQDSSSSLEIAARQMHEENVHGTLKLDFATTSAEEARKWMRSNAVPLAKISGNRPVGELESFVLQGVKRVLVQEKTVLLVAYRIDSRPVTLLAANEGDFSDIPTSGFLSKRVFLSSNSPRGMKIVNWTISGQTYVLVSDLPGSGLRGCLICHANDSPRKTIEQIEIRETMQSHVTPRVH